MCSPLRLPFLTFFHLGLSCVKLFVLGRQHPPAERSLAAYSSICLPAETPSIKANCHRNSEGKGAFFPQSLWMSVSCIYLIHLKAELLRSNESEADFSLRSPKSNSPYLSLLPSADSNCMNVSSNHLRCKRSYLHSAAYLLPALTKLSHNSFNCMLTVSSHMWYVHLE